MKKLIAALLSCALILPSVPAFAEDKQPVNVARNTAVALKTKTQTNTYSNMVKINDGITSDDGASFYGSGERVLYIDLGALYNVTEIKGYFGFPTKDGQIPEQFTFEWSKDGKTYETIETVNPNTTKEYDKVLDKAVQAQYISFTVPEASASRTIRVREIEIYGTYAGISTLNLALKKVVKSSANSDASVIGLTDGDTTTASTATAANAGAWSYNGKGERNAVIDLGEVCTVDSFKAYFGYTDGNDKPNTGFKIAYSADNEKFENAVDVEGNAYSHNYVVNLSEPVQARYIKLIINRADDARQVRVRELEVYGFVNEPYYTKSDDLQYTIYNYSNSLKDVVVIKAKYSDNALASVQMEQIDLFAPGTSKVIGAAADETVFIWNGINSMRPIAAR